MADFSDPRIFRSGVWSAPSTLSRRPSSLIPWASRALLDSWQNVKGLPPATGCAPPILVQSFLYPQASTPER